MSCVVCGKPMNKRTIFLPGDHTDDDIFHVQSVVGTVSDIGKEFLGYDGDTMWIGCEIKVYTATSNRGIANVVAISRYDYRVGADRFWNCELSDAGIFIRDGKLFTDKHKRAVEKSTQTLTEMGLPQLKDNFAPIDGKILSYPELCDVINSVELS